MGQRNFRLGRPVAGRQSIEDMVRQAYNNARKIDGLLGREAFIIPRGAIHPHLVCQHPAALPAQIPRFRARNY